MAPASARGSHEGDLDTAQDQARRTAPEGWDQTSANAGEHSPAPALGRAAGPPRGPGALMALQRAVGNQAVAQLLSGGARRAAPQVTDAPAEDLAESPDLAERGSLDHDTGERGAPGLALHAPSLGPVLGPEPVTEPVASASTPAAPAATARRWGATTRSGVPNLFGDRTPAGARRHEPVPRQLVQRYTTTDSLLTNVASVVGLDEKAKELTGAVTFESSGFAANVGGPLTVTRSAGNLDLSSQTYRASGTVKASGPKDSVGNYQIGFIQTVYESARHFYYEPEGSAPGLLARIVPVLFGERKKVSDTLSSAPVRDGDAGFRPWYGPETVLPFDKADSSTKSTSMEDTPNSAQPWTVGAGDKQQHLVKTDGKDRFRSWLAVKDKATDQAILLNHADWEVDYGTTVAFNKDAPASSVVTPKADSGSKVTSRAEGPGMKAALHDDPVANDVATEVQGLW